MKTSKPTLYEDLPEEIAVGIKAFYESYDSDPPEDILWRWGTIPLFKLAEEVWKDPVLQESHASFEAYHRWFKQGGSWPPKWTRRDPDSIYPILLTGPFGGPYDPEKGVIDDGWHRFHWYVDRWGRNKMIPVVWAVERARK